MQTKIKWEKEKIAERSGNAPKNSVGIKVLGKIAAGQKCIDTNEDIRAFGYIKSGTQFGKIVWRLSSDINAKHKINDPKRIRLGDKRVSVLKEPMSDDVVCEACGKSCGEERAEIGKRLSYHHEKYIEEDPLAYTIILCNGCHTKLHAGTLKCLMTEEAS